MLRNMEQEFSNSQEFITCYYPPFDRFTHIKSGETSAFVKKAKKDMMEDQFGDAIKIEVRQTKSLYYTDGKSWK